MLDVPFNLVLAAENIGAWFTENNIKHWSLGPCASREEKEYLEHVIAQLEAENSELRERLAKEEWFNRSK